MAHIAVIGAGISGLTAAYCLSREHRVTVLERANRIGGHTNTVVVDSENGPIAVDTGFIVHNRRTYPNFCRLMHELGVETQPSDMSFAVTTGRAADRESEFEYSSGGLNGFFAQRSNLLRWRHYRLLKEILRFNRSAPQLLENLDHANPTLGEYLESEGYPEEFVDRYLFPMASAIWSATPQLMRSFPAHTLIRFFVNHGLLAVSGHPPWRTIKGGSHSYLVPLTRPFQDGIRTGVQIKQVTRSSNGVRVAYETETGDNGSQDFDHVVFACHGNQILPMLGDASPREREILSAFSTSKNEAVLHTDESVLPRRTRARASWNYLLGANNRITVTYDMNRLQRLTTKQRYCVTLNPAGQVDEGKVIRRMFYFHPIFSHAAIQAQARWPEISGVQRTHFCGAYWRYGFHEDGVVSALRVVEAIRTRESIRNDGESNPHASSLAWGVA